MDPQPQPIHNLLSVSPLLPPSLPRERRMQPPMTSLNNLLNPESTYEYNRRVTQAHSGSPPSTAPSPPATIASERTVEENYYGQTNISITPHEPHPNCPDTLTCLPDTDGRPQHTLPVILRCAILGSPKKRLTIREIYAAMEKKYPYYKTAGPAWKQSVRHHLSLNRLFERQPRPATDPGFGSYWTVNLDAPPGTKRPRKRGRANKDAPPNSLPLENDALQALGNPVQTSLPPPVPPSHSHPSLPQSLSHPSHASLPHPLSHHPSIPPPLHHTTSAPSVTPSLPPQRPPSISPSAQPPTPHSASNSAPSSAHSIAPSSAPPFPKVREKTAESEYRLQDPPVATLRPVDSRSFNQGSTLRSAKYYDEEDDEDDMEWEEDGARMSDYDSAEDTPYQYDPRAKPSSSNSHPHPPHSMPSLSGRPALYGAFSSYASNPTQRSPETQPYRGPEPPPPPGYKGSPESHPYRTSDGQSYRSSEPYRTPESQAYRGPDGHLYRAGDSQVYKSSDGQAFRSPEAGDPLIERLKMEMAGLRRQSTDAVNASLRLSAQLTEAQTDTTRARATVKVLEQRLDEEVRRRREAEHIAEDEARLRLAAEDALRAYQLQRRPPGYTSTRP
ncbi:hypothetical protein DAEQUDRAFT_722506 [Daedalea quercina L-15889]|uniref:Fork-head domain-containing protein n=1 Tax=Daedalea quercina L-15889 TaxID=1314783 RepID=A0A165T3G5_9APHY|nr:hypothetical protein DAEQUDRAFT_722506 [Daedalea quercina L-15889]